jgi:hypothetical protein
MDGSRVLLPALRDAERWLGAAEELAIGAELALARRYVLHVCAAGGQVKFGVAAEVCAGACGVSGAATDSYLAAGTIACTYIYLCIYV